MNITLCSGAESLGTVTLKTGQQSTTTSLKKYPHRLITAVVPRGDYAASAADSAEAFSAETFVAVRAAAARGRMEFAVTSEPSVSF